MPNKIKPTVYLVKDNVEDIDSIFKDPNKLAKTQNDFCWLFYKKSILNPPKWAPFVSHHFGVNENSFNNSSSYAAIVLRIANRYFVLPLGMGIHLIDSNAIETNFGLRVALNCVPADKLRQLDSTSPESNALKTKKQSAKGSSPEEFGINKYMDILRGVVGSLPEDHPLGTRIEGKDSVQLSKSVESLDELIGLCEELLATFKMEKYKEQYPWIDNIAAISDPLLIDDLNKTLVSAIIAQQYEGMYIAPPTFIDDLHSYEGFRFTGDGGRSKNVIQFPTPTEVFQEYRDDFIKNLDPTTLAKTCKAHLVTEEGENRYGWGLNKCIHFEHTIDGKKYILSEGKWYRVDQNFYDEVESFYELKVIEHNDLPEVPHGLKKESDYNKFICDDDPDKYLFDLGHQDARNLHIGKGNEICDIYDVRTKEFIHVKAGKASSSISHLLRQGVFSAQTLKRDQQELQKFLSYLKDNHKCGKAKIPNPFEFTSQKVTFVLILEQGQVKNIPFFSKLSFKDACEQTFNLIGCEVSFTFAFREKAKEIQVDFAA